MLELWFAIIKLWPAWLGMVALIAASGFFSGSETALFSLTSDDLKAYSKGTRIQQRIARLMQQPDRLLTAILFCNLLINLSYFALSVVAARKLSDQGYSTTAGVLSLTALFLIIIFGEVIPKSLAVAFRRKMSELNIVPLSAVVRFLDSLLPFIQMQTRALRRTFWQHIEFEPQLDADDLEKVVDLSVQSAGTIDVERVILHNILDLSELTVEEVMRPRGTYLAMEKPATPAQFQKGLPPGGMVVVKQYGDQQQDPMVQTMPAGSRPLEPDEPLPDEKVMFVPWCAKVSSALLQMQTHEYRNAIVINEYGDTIGILCRDDIVDTVFSTQPSRTRRVLKREPVLQIDENRYHVDSLVTMRYLAQSLELDVDIRNVPNATLAGRLIEELGGFPTVGDTINWGGYRIRVIEVTSFGRSRVLMTKEETSPSSEDTQEENNAW